MEKYAFNTQFPLSSFQFKSSSKVKLVSRRDIESRLIEKALRDKAFKKKLIENPKTEINQLFEIQLPENMVLKVVEEDENHIYLVIPHNPYDGIAEAEIKSSLGMDLEELAGWVLDQHIRSFTSDRQKNVQIIANAWKNEAFKKLLIADPTLILESELREKIDSNFTITVLEETIENIYIVVPFFAGNPLDEREVETSFINMPMVIGSFVGTPVCTQPGHICF